jgi:pectate lyase
MPGSRPRWTTRCVTLAVAVAALGAGLGAGLGTGLGTGLVAAGGADVAAAPVSRRALPAVRAFPGAQGFGASTPGGRGGRVINVTNLNDSGPGSLRAAARATGRRIVVFRVSGTIRLKSDIDIVNPYVTVAGQTAPGGGITLRADPCNGKGVLGVHTHDVVLRYLRLRPGPHGCAGPGESSDGIVVYKAGAHHVVVDHCSISWAVDENVSLYDDAHHVTFSWNIISEGLAHSTHAEGEHSKGAHLSGENTYRISFHHNLLAHNNDRNPQPTNPGLADIRNNVIYNYGENAALTSNSHGRPRFNFVGNYFRPGPDSDRSEYELDVYGRTSVGWAFFVRGNIGPHRRTTASPNRWTVDPAGRASMVSEPFPGSGVRTTSAATALSEVLAGAGARVQHRDAVDRRVVRDVRERTGRIIDHPSDVGGWPVLPATSPPPDRDRDGMPNAWERARGLDPFRDDSRADRNGDGYTNVEEYLAWLVA